MLMLIHSLGCQSSTKCKPLLFTYAKLIEKMGGKKKDIFVTEPCG